METWRWLMQVWIWIIEGLLILVGIQIVWRWMSRKWSLPCPTALAWLLESRITDWIAGTTRTIQCMGIRPGQTVVEVGPGPGRLLIPIAKIVGEQGKAIGIDIQEGMLRRVRAKAERLGLLNVQLIHGDATRRHLEPATADVVFLSTVLGEIPDRLEALRRCREMLKPEGTLAITEIILDPHFQSRTVVGRLTSEAGFELVDTTGPWWSYTARFRKGAVVPGEPTVLRA